MSASVTALREREAGKTLDVVGLPARTALCRTGPRPRSLVVAYEPVWAIGTGLTPTAGDVTEVHAFFAIAWSSGLAQKAARVPILYGGSVKPSNATPFDYPGRERRAGGRGKPESRPISSDCGGLPLGAPRVEISDSDRVKTAPNSYIARWRRRGRVPGLVRFERIFARCNTSSSSST